MLKENTRLLDTDLFLRMVDKYKSLSCLTSRQEVPRPHAIFKRKFGFVKLENKLYFISASEFGFVKQDESIFFV